MRARGSGTWRAYVPEWPVYYLREYRANFSVLCVTLVSVADLYRDEKMIVDLF